MTTQVKDPQGIISVGQKGPEIDGSPVEFRYTHDEDTGALESCHVFAIVSSGGQDCLAEARAVTHPLDRGVASKVRGRMIAAGRMKQLMNGNTRANGCRIYNPSDVESNELFGKVFRRLQKRQ